MSYKDVEKAPVKRAEKEAAKDKRSIGQKAQECWF